MVPETKGVSLEEIQQPWEPAGQAVSTPKVASIGEVLWDLLPSGPQLGGAPANLACHVQALGGQAALVSRVGDDELGRRARTQLAARGVNLDAVGTDPSAPTGTVSVTLDITGQPHFTIVDHVAWDHLTADAAALRCVAAADAVCFGTLAQRSASGRNAIHTLLATVPPGRLILCDINLREPFPGVEIIRSSLQAATALKLNETELPVLASHFRWGGPTDAQVEALAEQFDLDTVILTLGASGSRIWHRGRWTEEPGRSVVVQDTVGAGDSFTAALVMGLLRGWAVSEAARLAADIAAYVCTQSGATPDLPPALTAPFFRSNR